MQWFRELLKDNEQLFLVTVMCLCGFGFVMVGSSSYVFSLEKYGEGFYFLKRHGAHLVVGLLFFLLFRRLGMKNLLNLSPVLWAGLLLSLILVLVPGIGVSVGGARRWVKFAFINFQPVEFLKALYPFLYALLVFRCIEKKGNVFNSFIHGIAPLLLVPLVFTGLLLMQPDFGSVVLLWVVTFSILFFSGLKFFHIVTLLGFLGGGFWAALTFSPYRMQRFLTFLDPWRDPFGKGFQVIQSFAAFHNGGLIGKGLGNSQAKLFFLPAAQNDFIFSIIGEELGFAGVIIVIALFSLFIKSAVNLAFRQATEVKSVAIMGFVTLIATQAFINMAVTLGVVPNKGLTLPFLSYGGSSIVALLLGSGILYGIATREEEKIFAFSLSGLRFKEKENKENRKKLATSKKTRKTQEYKSKAKVARSAKNSEKISKSKNASKGRGDSKKKTMKKKTLLFTSSRNSSKTSNNRNTDRASSTSSGMGSRTLKQNTKKLKKSNPPKRKSRNSFQSISSFGKGNSKSRSGR